MEHGVLVYGVLEICSHGKVLTSRRALQKHVLRRKCTHEKVCLVGMSCAYNKLYLYRSFEAVPKCIFVNSGFWRPPFWSAPNKRA